jgi:hypothetical protein
MTLLSTSTMSIFGRMKRSVPTSGNVMQRCFRLVLGYSMWVVERVRIASIWLVAGCG